MSLVGESVSESLPSSRKTNRTPVQATAQSCGGDFAKACRGLQPTKTAAWLAAGAGCGLRTAEYILSGEREPTKRAIAFVISKILN